MEPDSDYESVRMKESAASYVLTGNGNQLSVVRIDRLSLFAGASISTNNFFNYLGSIIINTMTFKTPP
jgi:hypothetical protein